MPRRKQNLVDLMTVKDSNENKETPLRRSKRNAVKEKNKAQIPLSFQEIKRHSPDSADNSLSSELSLKDETCMLSRKLATPYKVLSSILNNTCKAVQEKKSSEKPKLLRNKKRKVADLSDHISPNKKKNHSFNEKLISKDKSSELKSGEGSKITLQPIKKELFLEESQNYTVVDQIPNSLLKGKETALQVLAQHEFDARPECKIIGIKNFKDRSCDYDSSSESDWEEVQERKELNLDDYNPEIPKDGVEITIKCPEFNVNKRKKKQFDHMDYIRLYINRERKEHQLNIHKTHLLCLLAHGLSVNNILNSFDLQALALSYLPSEILALTAGRKIEKANSDVIHRLVSWFCGRFSFESKQLPFINFAKNIPIYFEEKRSSSSSEYNLMFLVFARTLGFKTRFCVSLYPVSHKAKNLLKKPDSKKESIPQTRPNYEKEQELKKGKSITSTQNNTRKKSIKSTKNKESKSDIKLRKNKSSLQRSANNSYKMSSDENDDFVEETPKKIMKVNKVQNRKIISSDSELELSSECSDKKNKIVCWCEVFSKLDKQWISIECTNKIIDKPYDIESLLPQKVTYILAYDNESYIKDVTKRYCSKYMTTTIKLRTDSAWWEETLEYFAPPDCNLNKEEEEKLDELLINKPLPKTIAEFKNHPLYALKRHLLKFEAIYPPDAAPVGYIREEPVYTRDNVCKLHSRETWVKEGRVVRSGEKPYKIVKARPKWDRLAGVMKTDLPLEVFGFWQTSEYEPPVAEGGKVPRNEYGNVELFKPCMLPRGTVHLQIPGLNRVAKKLGIDCSPAVVGFDGHKGSIHPVFDGFVVCKEFKDILLAAWDEEQENARKREEEKREKRIYGNWKKLIKGLLIREKIKLKYDMK